MFRALEGAGEQRGEFWKNRIVPYITSIWPQTVEASDPDISTVFGKICIAVQDDFPDAVEVFKKWLLPDGNSHILIYKLSESGFCEKFPEASLTFLDAIIGNTIGWEKDDLKQCLDDIKGKRDRLANDNRFRRLENLC